MEDSVAADTREPAEPSEVMEATVPAVTRVPVDTTEAAVMDSGEDMEVVDGVSLVATLHHVLNAVDTVSVVAVHHALPVEALTHVVVVIKDGVVVVVVTAATAVATVVATVPSQRSRRTTTAHTTDA